MPAMSEIDPQEQVKHPLPFNYGEQTERLAAQLSYVGTASDELAVMRHGVDENYATALSAALDTPIYHTDDPNLPRIGLIEAPGFLFSILPELKDRTDILLVTGRDINLMRWMATTANAIRENNVPGDCLEALVDQGGEEVREELENERDIMGPLHFLHDTVRLTECREALRLSNLRLQATDIGHMLAALEIQQAITSIGGSVTFASLSDRGDMHAPQVAYLMSTASIDECPILYSSRFQGWRKKESDGTTPQSTDPRKNMTPIIIPTPYTAFCLGSTAYKTAALEAWNELSSQ